MEFQISATIDRPPGEVFIFLRDIDRYPQKEGSPVAALDKTTAGPVGVGTRYREVVRMLPFVEGQILSEITCFEPDACLAMDWDGGGMEGHLVYRLDPDGAGTRLTQTQTLNPRGALRLLSPLIRLAFSRAIARRLQAIKWVLEEERSVT